MKCYLLRATGYGLSLPFTRYSKSSTALHCELYSSQENEPGNFVLSI
jgi:hypothetical protein